MNLRRILFLDIETVSGQETFEELSPRMQALWQKKAMRFIPKGQKDLPKEEVDWPAIYKDRAAILAEFGKVICISVGFIVAHSDGEWGMRIKSFSGRDEQDVLTRFADLIKTSFEDKTFAAVCGHNVKEFDLPYICRRMLIHQLELPPAFQLQGKKPWELNHIIDTMELWKFGDYKHYTSLDLLAALFDIPSPKEDIDGSQVGTVFYDEGDLDRIARYCERDVFVTAAVYMQLVGQGKLDEKHVTYA